MEIHIILFLSLMISIFVILPMCIKLFVRNKTVVRWISLVLFILFLAVMLTLTLAKVSIGKIVTIKFESYGGWCDNQIYLFEKFSITDMIINLAMLTPIGIFVWSKERKAWKNLIFAMIFGFLCGLFIETLQFILPVARTVQVQDVLFNMTSALLGSIAICIIYAFLNISKKRGNKEYEQFQKNKNNG